MMAAQTSSPEPHPPVCWSQAGDGPDVVLVHGALVERHDLFCALGAGLVGQFRVTALDRTGHGQAPFASPTGSPWRQAQAVRHAVSALGLKAPIVIGHSFGGAVALAYALQFPNETRGVVALAPIAFPEMRLEHWVFGPRGLPVWGPFCDSAFRLGVDPLLLPVLRRAMFWPQAPRSPEAQASLSKPLRAEFGEVEGEDANFLNLGLACSAVSYASCRVPVRVLAGDRDIVVNPEFHGRWLSRLLPLAEFHLLPGLGHMIHHFAQAEIVRAALELDASSGAFAHH
jgi:pimeloyl-ACP methyl ester carboxylesterase